MKDKIWIQHLSPPLWPQNIVPCLNYLTGLALLHLESRIWISSRVGGSGSQLRFIRPSLKCHRSHVYIGYDGHIQEWELGTVIGCFIDFSLKLGESGCQLRIIRPSVPVVVPREERRVDYSSDGAPLLQGYNATICLRSGDICDFVFHLILFRF